MRKKHWAVKGRFQVAGRWRMADCYAFLLGFTFQMNFSENAECALALIWLLLFCCFGIEVAASGHAAPRTRSVIFRSRHTAAKMERRAELLLRDRPAI